MRLIAEAIWIYQLIAVNDPKGKPMTVMSSLVSVQSAHQLCDDSCPDCNGNLRVIARIEDPPLIAKIRGCVQRREALIGKTARGPPAILHEVLKIRCLNGL